MKREHLEHLIRAACRIAEVKKIYIFGSQSILGKYPDAYSMFSQDGVDFLLSVKNALSLTRSVEADILVPDSDHKTELIEGALGEQSTFHNTHGYYAQGIDMTTCTLPQGWEHRLTEIIVHEEDGPFVGLCLDPADMVLSKLYANREKDIEFSRNALSLGIVTQNSLLKRLNTMPISQDRKETISRIIKGLASNARQTPSI